MRCDRRSDAQPKSRRASASAILLSFFFVSRSTIATLVQPFVGHQGRLRPSAFEPQLGVPPSERMSPNSHVGCVSSSPQHLAEPWWTVLDPVEDLVEPDDLSVALDAKPVPCIAWDTYPPSARKAMLWWVISAGATVAGCRGSSQRALVLYSLSRSGGARGVGSSPDGE